jgi:hypothetical protein
MMNGIKVSVKYTNCLLVKNGSGFGEKKSLNGWSATIGLTHKENKESFFITENLLGFTGVYSGCFISADSTYS